jgi:hypothetical protein
VKGFRYISVAAVVALCSAAAYAHGGWQKQSHEVHRPPERHAPAFTQHSNQNGYKAQHDGRGKGSYSGKAMDRGPVPPSKFTQNPQPLVRRPVPGPHAGDWLRQYGSLPPQQQQRMLEQDPQFRRLPPEQQQHLRERLNTFNALPPQQRQRVLNRMDTLGRLTPDQRHRANDLYAQFRTVDPDRRSKMMLSLRQMRGMSPEARQQWLNSPQMRKYYSPHELDLLRGMSDLGVGSGPEAPPR